MFKKRTTSDILGSFAKILKELNARRAGIDKEVISQTDRRLFLESHISVIDSNVSGLHDELEHNAQVAKNIEALLDTTTDANSTVVDIDKAA